jgi:hypothetical protein
MNTQEAAIHYGGKLRRKPKTKREDCGCELSATIPITRSVNPNCEIHSPTRPREQDDDRIMRQALFEVTEQRDELLAEIGMSVTRSRMVAQMDKNQVRQQAKLEILRLVETDINATIKAVIAKCEADK